MRKKIGIISLTLFVVAIIVGSFYTTVSINWHPNWIDNVGNSLLYLWIICHFKINYNMIASKKNCKLNIFSSVLYAILILFIIFVVPDKNTHTTIETVLAICLTYIIIVSPVIDFLDILTD